MPINPEIALSVKSPQFDTAGVLNLIAQSQQRKMQQESHAQEIQLGKQRLAQGEVAARESQLKAKDDQIQSESFLRSGGDQKKHAQLMAEAGARPQAVMATEQHYADYNKKTADTSKTELENRAKANELLLPLHDQALSGVQDGTIAQNWPSIWEQMNAVNPQTAHHFSPDQLPTAQQLTASKNAHVMQDYSIKAAKEARDQAEELRKQEEEKQQSIIRPDQAAKIKADAQIAAEAAAGKTKIQPAEQARLDLQRRTLEHGIAHDAATEANATALLRVHQQGDARAQQIYNQTYGEGANPALVGVEPKLRVQASSAAQKAADEYTKAAEATGNMQSIIDLARSGNKIAYAYAPTTGVLTINTAMGVKRVNMPEIKSYGGAGSAADRVEGWLGKQVSGASIPKEILTAMEEVNNSVRNGASGSYNSKLAGINQNYRSNFQPVKVEGAANPAATSYKQTATGANGHKIGTNDNGATWFDTQTGQKVQ